MCSASYPSDNCAVVWPDPNNPPKDPQEMWPQYLTHNAGINFAQPYLNSTALAQQWGKPFLLFETNSASCGGFPGISDSFGAALWGIDHALQLAHSNFSGTLFHFGGQNVSYNVSRALCGVRRERVLTGLGLACSPSPVSRAHRVRTRCRYS